MQQFILTPTGRQEQRFLKLKVWMLEHGITKERLPFVYGITFESIGKFLGISGRSVSKSLRNERMPVRHHRVLRYRLDIPVELLPRAEDVPTGPKPRTR